MTPFGNPDFERTPVPAADSGNGTGEPRWEHDTALSRLLDRPTGGVTRDTRRVVVRLHGGEEVELGRVEGREPAVQIARDMVTAVEQAESAGDWPLVGDRFLRPAAIVSIDVQRASV